MANVIAKNRKAYGYDYADLGSVVTYVTETLGYEIEHDIIYDDMPPFPNCYGFVVTRYRRRGSTDDKAWSDYRCPVPIIVGEPSGKRDQPFMQRWGSAETYARRYSLLTTFGLATADDDGQLAGYQRGGLMGEEQRRRVNDLLAGYKVPSGGESMFISKALRQQVDYARMTAAQADMFVRACETDRQRQPRRPEPVRQATGTESQAGKGE